MFDFDDDYKPMVTIQKIAKIAEHPNADKLELAFINDWQVQVQKDIFKEGDLVIYFEIDSVLPENIEKMIFGEDAKIKLTKSRVKTIKIRKLYSQGLIVPVKLFEEIIGKVKYGMDITKVLGVKKYEEPVKEGNILHVEKKPKKYENPNFKKVRKPDNIKHFKGLYIGKQVSVTEKLHGSSMCAGWVKRSNVGILNKILMLIYGEYEFVYRSMNVQLQKRKSFWNGLLNKLFFKDGNGFYEKQLGKDIYSEMVKKYKLKDVIDKGFVVTGEVIGDGIQKGYNYGCKSQERKLIIFGVRKDEINIDYKSSMEYIKSIGLEYVPILYEGILTQENLHDLTNGKSVYDPKTKVREGCVVECLEKNIHPSILKSISEAYLMGDNTDFH